MTERDSTRERQWRSGAVAMTLARMAVRSAIERGDEEILANLMPASSWRGPRT